MKTPEEVAEDFIKMEPIPHSTICIVRIGDEVSSVTCPLWRVTEARKQLAAIIAADRLERSNNENAIDK